MAIVTLQCTQRSAVLTERNCTTLVQPHASFVGSVKGRKTMFGIGASEREDCGREAGRQGGRPGRQGRQGMSSKKRKLAVTRDKCGARLRSVPLSLPLKLICSGPPTPPHSTAAAPPPIQRARVVEQICKEARRRGGGESYELVN